MLKTSSTAPLPPLTAIPRDIACVSDYEAFAKPRMSEAAWAYFSGGAGNGSAIQRASQAFEEYLFLPRLLQDFTQAHTHTDVLGRRYPFPVFLAPVAYQKMAHPHGELASTLAASAMQTLSIISMQSSTAIEDIAQQAQAPLWFQWYPQQDKLASKRLLQRVEQAGYEAIVFTLDAPINGIRYQEQRVGFTVPSEAQAVNLSAFKDQLAHVGQPGSSPIFDSGILQHSLSWAGLQEFIAETSLPVLVKGILNPSDVELAIQAGAAGIVVSNHGGRILDALPAPITMLPKVVKAVDGRVPVLCDGGIRSGTQVAIALALGADAVMIGRPYIYGLTTAGAPGVAHVLHMLRTELEACMTLVGATCLQELKERLL